MLHTGQSMISAETVSPHKQRSIPLTSRIYIIAYGTESSLVRRAIATYVHPPLFISLYASSTYRETYTRAYTQVCIRTGSSAPVDVGFVVDPCRPAASARRRPAGDTSCAVLFCSLCAPRHVRCYTTAWRTAPATAASQPPPWWWRRHSRMHCCLLS